MPDQQSWLTTLGQAFARPDTSQEHVAFTTASPLVNITDEDINRGMNVAMAAGPGSIKGVAADPATIVKPLTEKQFYKQYSQHLDLRGRQTGNSDAVAQQVMESGFKRGANVNTLPPYRGGEPQNIIDMKFAPMAGDTVYLVPNKFTREMGNGRVINEGWKPQPHEVIKVDQDYPSLYQEYLKSLQRHSATSDPTDMVKKSGLTGLLTSPMFEQK